MGSKNQPVRETYLPYSRQWISDEDVQSVINVLRSNFLTTGPAVEQFETKVSDYVGSKYAVSFSSGTAALHAACDAAGIKEGDEVITTPITFAATSNSVLYQGGTPVFSDINRDTYNIDPISVKEKITDKTKAIIPVHFTGQPVDLDPIIQIAKENNLLVIEDAAHALGSVYKGRKVGSISDMTAFSFHPVKPITCGEGGMVTTNNQEFYEKLLDFRSHGITRNRQRMNDLNRGPWYYEMQTLGYNYRLTDIHAALGVAQMDRADLFLKKRGEYAELYNEKLAGIPGIRLPKLIEGIVSSWHLYIIEIDDRVVSATRDEIFKDLQAENIGVNLHYIPVYHHPYYRSLGYKAGICPSAEQMYERIITIPLFAQMLENDVSDVVKAIDKTVRKYIKGLEL